MATINSNNNQILKRFYLRYNPNANGTGQGAWEVIYFYTDASAVAETGVTLGQDTASNDRRFVTNAEKTAITAIQPSYQAIIDQTYQNVHTLNTGYTLAANTVLHKGDLLLIDSNFLYVIGETKTLSNATSEFNSQGSDVTTSTIGTFLSTNSITATHVGSFASVAQYNELQTNKVNKSAILDANNKILLNVLPDSILGQMVYGGTVSKGKASGASQFSITINFSTNGESILTSRGITVTNHKQTLTTDNPSSANISKYEGMYFIVAGGEDETTTPHTAITSFDFGTYTGENNFQVGDWLVATNDTWKKIDNTDAVTTVNGHLGDVSIYYGNFIYDDDYDDFPHNQGDIFSYTNSSGTTLYIVKENYTLSNAHDTGANFFTNATTHILPLGHGSASTSYAGVVQLTNSIAEADTDQTKATTPKGVSDFVKKYTTKLGSSEPTEYGEGTIWLKESL